MADGSFETENGDATEASSVPESYQPPKDFKYLGHGMYWKDQERLVSLCQDIVGAETVVEVGCYVGQTSLALARNTEADIFCVDTFRGAANDPLEHNFRIHGSRQVFRTFAANTKKYLNDRIFLCVGDSQHWAEIWPTPIDVVFIDADHSHEGVTKDLKSWWPLVRPGGIISGHDFISFPAVKHAVQSFFRTVNSDGNVWWYQKENHDSYDSDLEAASSGSGA